MYTNDIIKKIHLELVNYMERSGDNLINKDKMPLFIDRFLDQNNFYIPSKEKKHIISTIINKMIGLGPLTEILNDSNITEVMVNGINSLYVERNGLIKKLKPCFESEEEIMEIINRIVSQIGRRIDISSPLVDARLPDGSRVNAIIWPLSLVGPILTIRRFPEKVFSINDLIKKKSISEGIGNFMKAMVLAKQNIVISGGTGSGKTTLLNVLASLIKNEERIITIEDAAEIKLKHDHLISLEARMNNLEGKGEISVRVLLKNALRMRPDRIIIGEIRGGEALDMLQAMNTGHKGSITTVHANAPLESLLRIETMALMADLDLPLKAIHTQVNQAIDFIIQQERLADGTRCITAISELISKDDKSFEDYELKPIFTFDKQKNKFVGCGLPHRQKDFADQKVELDPNWFI